MTDQTTPSTCGELSAILFSGRANFSPGWLSGVDGIVVPLESHTIIDRTLAGVLRVGATAVGVNTALAGQLGEEHAEDQLLSVSLMNSAALMEVTWQGTDFVVALPDLSAALVVTTDGYSLLGGSPAFVRGAVNGGVDDARARFGHYADKLGGVLLPIAARYPPLHQPWATTREVEPGSAVAEQLDLMTSLVSGEISPQSFASAWMAASRRQQNGGERTHDALGTALHDVFFAIEDYGGGPSLWEPGDLTDDEFLAKVRETLASLGL
jgi:self-protective colicin-like immunity protein